MSMSVGRGPRPIRVKAVPYQLTVLRTEYIINMRHTEPREERHGRLGSRKYKAQGGKTGAARGGWADLPYFPVANQNSGWLWLA